MKKIADNSLFDLKSVAQVQVLNDEVFFVETSMREKENDYVTKIKSVNQLTKKITIWGDKGSINTHIKLSPHQDYLSYLSNDNTDKKMQIHIIPTTYGSAIDLSCEENGVNQYLWSKDGKSIYFMTTQSNDPKEKEVDKKDNKPQVKNIDKIVYQHDGIGVLSFDKKYILKKVDVVTNEVSTIHEFDEAVSLAYVSNHEDFIVFNQSDTVKDEFEYAKSRPYQLNLLTKEVRVLVEEQGTYYFETANEDETVFIISGHDFSLGFVTQTNLYALNCQTLALSNLTESIDLELGDLLVADFQQQVRGVSIKFVAHDTILFSATEHGKVQLYTVTLDGVVTKVVDERCHLTSAILEDTKVYCTYSTVTLPSVVGVYNVLTHQFDVLYNPNTDFEKEHLIVEPTMYYFKGYNNWNIQSWYLKPIEEKEKYPLILYIHGGPQVAYGETFFHEMQSLVGKGYAVLMINPRGGNSYGQEFVASILGDYGNHDFDDLMLGLDDILQKDHLIDTNNIFVTGGSYGGFMTNWIVGHTNRFKAAVTQRSISNWISFYGVSDIGFAFVENQLKADLSNQDRLWELSPLAYAGQVKTPLLILHGESDFRCPIEQAQQFYTALKRNKVTTKLVTFPQSSHGLSREGLPNLRLDRLKAISDWFDGYCK